MPSIPQSLLWISLVVLWLFVLVPMLISKRDAVRRTSDVALATRVLNGGAGSRLLKRSGPAAGHRSDPHWKPEEDPAEDELAEPEQDQHDEDEHTDDLEATRPVAMNVAVAEEVPAEPDYLDVDVIEERILALHKGDPMPVIPGTDVFRYELAPHQLEATP